MQAEVRRPLLRGSQLVRALWFDGALLGEDEARRRLLRAWETGAQAHRLEDGYLLAWRSARRLRCEGAPGLPLCDQDGVLASAPLLPEECAGIAPGAAVLVRGAHLRVHTLDADTRIDPSTWLDVSAIPVCVALTPPRADAGFDSVVPEAAPDVRSLLGDAVPPPSREREAFLREALRQVGHAEPGGHAGTGSASAKAAGLAGALAGLLLLPLAGLFARRGNGSGGANGGRGGSTGGRAGAAASEGIGQRRQAASSRFGDWLAARAAKLALATRVARLIGWRQANYLRKMLRQFEEGNLDEALRHAIPLDGRNAPTRQAFGIGGRRDKLEIGGGAGAASIGLDDESIDLLRQTYQRSFDMLDRAGRIDEAVFVLAELMNRHQEAVDYLERKERYAQAAQLAETLELPLASAIRLYCKAGNVARAVQLARLGGGFAEAVAELERRRDPGAAELRLEWAEDLAARGYLVEAAKTVWPLERKRTHALAWLRAAEAGGGSLGTQALVYTLALNPETLRARAPALQAMLSAPGEEAGQHRLRLGECLLQLDGHNEATRRLAAELWRVLAAERSAGLHAMPGVRLSQLLKLAQDPVLAEDLPRTGWSDAPAPLPLARRADTLHLSFAEQGLYALAEARVLPDGGHLLALGEGGVVLAREGRAPLRFPVPADYLVVSDNGRRALALGQREKAVRVSRIDLVSGKFEDWFSADLAYWADEYDGAAWSVVADGRLMVLDARAQGRSVLWQIGDLPGRIVGFEQHKQHQALLLRHEGGVEQWRYILPARRLLARTLVDYSEHAFGFLPDCGNEAPLVIGHGKRGDAPYLAVPVQSRAREVEVALAAGWPRQVSVYGDMLLMQYEAHASEGAFDFCCQLLNAERRVVTDIRLPGATHGRAIVHAGHLLAWDRHGRLVDVDLATAAVRTLTFG